MNFIFLFHKIKDTINPESLMETAEDTILESTLLPSVLEQSIDRTLCDSQVFNANSISTPFLSSLRKQIPSQNFSNLEVSSICVSEKKTCLI